MAAVRVPAPVLERHLRDGTPVVVAWLQQLGLPIDSGSGEAALLDELAAALAVPAPELAEAIEALHRR